MELRLTCLLASSRALSSCLASDPHSRVFSSSRSWDWWMASSLLAITWRNSTFWALVASSFLGERTQSDPVLTHLYIPPSQGGAITPGLGVASHQKSPRSHGKKPKEICRLAWWPLRCATGAAVREQYEECKNKSTPGVCHTRARCQTEFNNLQLTRACCYHPHSRGEENDAQRGQWPKGSLEQVGLSPKSVPSTSAVHCCLPQQRDFG